MRLTKTETHTETDRQKQRQTVSDTDSIRHRNNDRHGGTEKEVEKETADNSRMNIHPSVCLIPTSSDNNSIWGQDASELTSALNYFCPCMCLIVFDPLWFVQFMAKLRMGAQTDGLNYPLEMDGRDRNGPKKRHANPDIHILNALKFGVKSIKAVYMT